MFGRSNGASTIEVTQKVRKRIGQATHDLINLKGGSLIRVKPSPDGQGLSGGKEIFETLAGMAQFSLLGLHNSSPAASFEIWMEDEEIKFQFYAPLDRAETLIAEQVKAAYSDAKIERTWSSEQVESYLQQQLATEEYQAKADVPLRGDHIPLPSEIENARYLSADRFSLKNPRVYPVRKWEEAEEEETVRAQEQSELETANDPYRSLLSSMNADEAHHTVLQIAFQPARDNWVDRPGWGLGFVAWRTHSEDAAEEYEEQEERSFANRIRNRRDNPGFRINIRVLSMGREENTVQKLVDNVSHSLESKFAGKQQTFERAVPSMRKITGVYRDSILHTINCNLLGQAKIYISDGELGTLAHLPNSEIDNSAVAWNTAPTGTGIPPDAPTIGLASGQTFPANRKPERIPTDPSKFRDEGDEQETPRRSM